MKISTFKPCSISGQNVDIEKVKESTGILEFAGNRRTEKEHEFWEHHT